MMTLDINEFKPFRSGKYPEFPSSENGCTHIGQNIHRHSVRHFKIDGVVVTRTDIQKCDFLLLNDEAQTSYYIELKGSDLAKAIDQIENTVSMISASIPQYRIFRRIVYRTGSHSIKTSKVTLWQKKHGRSAQIKERMLRENI